MTRRTAILAGLLVASAAALAANPPRKADFAEFRTAREFVPYPAESMISDPRRTLDAARMEIESELHSFVSQLAIGVQILVTEKPQDLAPIVATQLERRDDEPWSDTGRIRIVIGTDAGEIRIGTSDGLRDALPDAVVRELFADRVAPFLGHPLAGVAVASGLRRIRDQLLERALAGTLELEGAAAESAPAVRFRALAPAIESQCAAVAGDEPEARAEAFVCALARGGVRADDPLLSEASRFHLSRQPLLPFESRTRAIGLLENRPWTVSVSGERAALHSADPNVGMQTVFLIREGGAWRVDLVEMEKAFRKSGTRFHARNEIVTPYWLVLGAEPPRVKPSLDLSPVELWGEPLADAVARLERSETPIARRRLAEILLRNAWLPGEALVQWDDALALDPSNTSAAQEFADRAELLGYPLLGAIALAPHGPEQMARVGELLVKAGKVESGVQVIVQMNKWRAEMKAIRAKFERVAKPSI